MKDKNVWNVRMLWVAEQKLSSIYFSPMLACDKFQVVQFKLSVDFQVLWKCKKNLWGSLFQQCGKIQVKSQLHDCL